jgi:hypothetical protein
VTKQADDFFKTGAAKDYQDMVRKSWEAFAAHMQPPFGAPSAEEARRSSSTSTKSAPVNLTLDHALAGLKSYADWLQSAAASVSTPQNDWQQQIQQLFTGASQPFSHGFAGADNAASKTFVEQWQAWLNSQQKTDASAASAKPQAPGAGGFGFGNEQHAQQQALADAIAKHLEAAQRYQALMQRSNAQAIEKMQARLSKLTAPGQQIESLKVLYDLWVDCAEEAYAEIALSEEFREAYGEMVNTQIRVRQLQQEQTEYLCQQLGIPTRSDVSSLGERLHSLRREMRQGKTATPADHTEELEALRRDVALLKEQLLASASSAPRSATRKAPKPKTAVAKKVSRSAVKKSVAKPPSKKIAKAAVKKQAAASPPSKPVARAKPRKRS